MGKQKYLFIIGLISVFASGGLLFAKPEEGQSAHRSRGRSQNERTAPSTSDTAIPAPQPAPSPDPASIPAETPTTISPAPAPTPAQTNTARRERIRKKFRRELIEETDRRGDTDEIRVIVRYRNLVNETHIGKIQTRGGKLKKKFRHHPWAAFTVKKTDLFAEYFDEETVEGIEFDSPVSQHLDTSLPAISAAAIEKNYAVTGKGVRMAIIDSGIAKNHPALSGKVIVETDFTGEGPEDLNGHGTHVACIIACSDALYRGVAPDVFLYNAKVISQSGAGLASDVIAGIEWAIDQKVDMLNLSLGIVTTLCDGKDSLSIAINTAFDNGILPVVSAGNSGPAASTINSPACAEKALTVGAVSDTGQIAEFSSRGPTADGRVKPDIAAPGIDVFSANLNAGFVSKSGTSMAAPHVSGVAALLKSMAPTKTPIEIRELILKNVNLLSYDGNTAGAGFLNAEKSVAALKNQPEPTPPEPPPPPPSPPPSPPPEEPVSPPPPPSEEPEKEKRGRGNPLAQCLKGARGDHEAKRACLKEFNPGVHRGFEKFEDAQKDIPEEKIPEKELKAIERIIFEIPATNSVIERQIEKKLEEFQRNTAEKNEDEIAKEVKKLQSSLKKLKRRAARRSRAR